MPSSTEFPASATFFQRLAAYLLDKLLLLIVFLPLRVLFKYFPFAGQIILFRLTAADIFLWLIGILYFTLLTAFAGQTVGKLAFGIRVVSEEGTKPEFFAALYREAVGRYLSSLLFIGYFFAAFRRDGKALHDLLADTRVVAAARE